METSGPREVRNKNAMVYRRGRSRPETESVNATSKIFHNHWPENESGKAKSPTREPRTRGQAGADNRSAIKY